MTSQAIFLLSVAAGLVTTGLSLSLMTWGGSCGPKMLARKPRVRISENGWIRHMGGSFPFDPHCVVEIVFFGGDSPSVGAARETPDSWWRGEAADPIYDVEFYRIIGPRRRWS